MDIKITIEATGLERAMTLLAEAIGYKNFVEEKHGGCKCQGVNEKVTPAEQPVLEGLIPPTAEPIKTAPKQEAKSINVDEAKKRVASIVKQPGKSAVLKAYLEECGAKKISDLQEDKLEDLLTRLEES